MRFYGITMEGKFVNHTLDTVPAVFNTDTDPGRLIYTLDDGLLWWGDGTSSPPRWRSISDGSSVDDGEAEDMYSDLLRTTVFLNGTWDEFAESTTNNAYIDNSSDMTWDDSLRIYNYTAGQTLQSTNLFDNAVTSSEIRHCMPSVWWVRTSGSVTPTIYVTADGGTHWEIASNNNFHEFAYPGIDLRMKVVIPSGTPTTGFIRSWSLLYNKDLSVSCSRQALTTYEITIEAPVSNIITTTYTPGALLVYLNGIKLQDVEDFTAEDGETITIHSPDLEVGDVVTVISFTTMVTGSSVDLSPYIKKDGSVTYEANQPMGNYKLTGLAAGTDPNDSVRIAQLSDSDSAHLNRHYKLYNSALTTVLVDSGTLGQVSMSYNRVTNVDTPTANGDAVNLSYADNNYTPITHVTSLASSSLFGPYASETIYGHAKIWIDAGILRIQTT